MHYVVTHWRGEQGLLRSTLFNGVLSYAVVVLGVVGLGALFDNRIGAWCGLATFSIWLVWAVVGIFRCGLRNVMHSGGKITSRIGGLLAIVGMCAFSYFSAEDLIHLGFFRWLHSTLTLG
jgi:peptidoglycan/LPS O-acetylase OafA/YrhL